MFSPSRPRRFGEEFLFAGIGLTITFAPADGGPRAGLPSVAEGRCDCQWQHIRWLNGDQTHQGRHVRLEQGCMTLQRVNP